MLNAQIPLQGQPMQLEPRANALMRAMQMRGMQQDQQFRQAQMQKLQEAAQQSLMERQKTEEAARLRDAALAQVQGGGRLDPVAMMRAGMDPKLIEFLANRENLGRPEVARTAEIAGPDGRPVTVQLDKFGRPVGDGMPKAVESKLIDLGGDYVPYNPYALKPEQKFTKTMTPDGRAADARARAAQAQSAAQHAERLAFDRTKDVVGGAKAPTGYRFTVDGSLEAIPGGPADIKAGEMGAKREQGRQFSMRQAENVLSTIGDAKKKVGFWTTGFGAESLAEVGGTAARDLQANLTTIKANLGFDRLQQMREASPTGGALGQVAVQELVALQATVASLDQAQTQGQLRDALTKVEKHYQNWLDVMKKAGLEGGKQPDQGGDLTTEEQAELNELRKRFGVRK